MKIKIALVAVVSLVLSAGISSAAAEKEKTISPTIFAELVEESGTCEGGWQLQCSGGTCCTVCQATGTIGACHSAT